MWRGLRTPTSIGRIIAIVGLVTVASALTPEIHSRVHLITDVLPSVFPAAATTGTIGIGIILIVLSRALRRGKFRAWLVATVLTAITVALHIVKGLDVEEAILSGAVLALLISARKNFTAHPDPRSVGRVVQVFIGGALVGTASGWAWLALADEGQTRGTTNWDRIQQAFLGLVGIPGPIHFVDSTLANRSAWALAVLGAAVLVLLVMAAMMPKGGPHPLSTEERAKLDALLEKWGHIDSLSYFATRGDRSVIFSPTGKAAITYRVVGTTSLAPGDPIGDPEAWPGAIDAWIAEARSYGWVPATVGSSERGATAFARAGMDAIEIGDEAILDVDEFTLEGRPMRVVRQAVSRCRRNGLTVSASRLRDLDEDIRQDMREHAVQWRDSDIETGFSMALDRHLDPSDGDTMVVICRDGDGEMCGLLGFVPWGPEGLSLDLMRRRRDSENGVMELMVTELVDVCRKIGVRRISLNFAIFRSVFARGERVGAGPVLRLWLRVLLIVSRFWQIESLYRANAKYRPEWVPRFICFARPGDVPRILIAVGRVEQYLALPSWLRRFKHDHI